jgi:hypothetical protein
VAAEDPRDPGGSADESRIPATAEPPDTAAAGGNKNPGAEKPPTQAVVAHCSRKPRWWFTRDRNRQIGTGTTTRIFITGCDLAAL